jgi:pyridoxamine 5'-phosphate oxidase
MPDDDLRNQLRRLPVFGEDMPVFNTDEVPGHPAELFAGWLLHAIEAGVREPHAMTLSTVDSEGRPSSRVLILKGLTDGRWEFATSRQSRKGRELSHSPWVAANFYWPELGRQVRLRGRVIDAGSEAAARDFLARPAGSRAESLVGNQSQPLRDPVDLDVALERAQELTSTDPELVAEDWALFGLIADEVEFWQADARRRHIRLCYRLEAGSWISQRLWP